MKNYLIIKKNMKNPQNTPVSISENKILSETLNIRKYEKNIRLLKSYLSHDVLNTLLPDPEIRPILLAAILHELGEISSWNLEWLKNSEWDSAVVTKIQEEIRKTKIFQILDRQYQPIFMHDIAQSFKQRVSEAIPETFDKVSDFVWNLSDKSALTRWIWRELPNFIKKPFTKHSNELSQWYDKVLIQNNSSLNSSLKNLWIAVILNETVFKHSKYKARISLAQYRWDEHVAKSAKWKMPTLPDWTDKKNYLKFVIAISDWKNNIPISYMDYWQNE